MEVLFVIVGVLTFLSNFNFVIMATPSHRLGYNLALGHIKEFAYVIRVCATFASALVFLKIINFVVIFTLVNMGSPCSNSLLDF